MDITRDVILDLLPLYLANEGSADTRALVEEYLKTDPALAKIAAQRPRGEPPEDIVGSVTEEARIEADRRARRLRTIGGVVLAVIIAAAIGLALLALLMLSGRMPAS